MARPAVVLFALLLLTPRFAGAADAERGKRLYETFCNACHGESVHARKNRIVKTPADLTAQVRRWQSNIGQRWSDEEIDDVAAYLGASVYRFDCDGDKC